LKMWTKPEGNLCTVVLTGIISEIKMDTSARELARHPGEKVTEGLDGLRDRLIEYFRLCINAHSVIRLRIAVNIPRRWRRPPNRQ